MEVDLGRPQIVDLVTAECTPGQSGIRMDLEADATLGARHEIAQEAVPPRLRRAAMESLLRQNVQWLGGNATGPGARAFLLNQPQWGNRLSGAGERNRL